jgi:hypothetical protein
MSDILYEKLPLRLSHQAVAFLYRNSNEIARKTGSSALSRLHSDIVTILQFVRTGGIITARRSDDNRMIGIMGYAAIHPINKKLSSAKEGWIDCAVIDPRYQGTKQIFINLLSHCLNELTARGVPDFIHESVRSIKWSGKTTDSATAQSYNYFALAGFSKKITDYRSALYLKDGKGKNIVVEGDIYRCQVKQLQQLLDLVKRPTPAVLPSAPSAQFLSARAG